LLQQTGLSADDDGDTLLGDQLQARQLIPGALYAPRLLLAVLSCPHSDALATWLPLVDSIAKCMQQQVDKRAEVSAAAAKAAFPPLPQQAPDGDAASAKRPGGLPLAQALGGWRAACVADSDALMQARGHAAVAHALLSHWRDAGGGSATGTGALLMQLLSEALPAMGKVDDPSKQWPADDALHAPAAAAPGSGGGAAGGAADGQAWPQLRGAAAATGVPPPWGMDIEAVDAVLVMRDASRRANIMCALNVLNMLLLGPPTSVKALARKLADRPLERIQLARQPGLNPAAALNPDGSLGPWTADISDIGAAAADQPVLLQDGLEPRALLRELLEGGVLDVLDRVLRTAVCALMASDADQLWGGAGGVQQVWLGA
jgi:hypothetical protein